MQSSKSILSNFTKRLCCLIQPEYFNGSSEATSSNQPVVHRIAELLDTSTVDDWLYIAGVNKTGCLGTEGVSFDDVGMSNRI